MARTEQVEVSITKDLVEVEDGAGFVIFAATLEWLRKGLWQIAWPTQSLAGKYIDVIRNSGEDIERYGVVVRSRETRNVIFSGPMNTIIKVLGSSPGFSANTVTVYGFTGWAYFHGAILYPLPATDIPISSTAGSLFNFGAFDDTENGPAETVALTYINDTIGPGAPITDKRVPGLVVPTTQGRGSTLEFGGRFQDLGDVVRSICEVGGITMDVLFSPSALPNTAGTLDISVDVQQSRPEVLFSVDAGSAAGIVFKTQRARINSSVIAGSGSGPLRPFGREEQSAPVGGWNRRREQVNETSADSLDKFTLEANDVLAKEAPEIGVTFDVADGTPFEVGVDYNLGDQVTVSDGPVEIQAKVTTVYLTYGGDGADSSRQLSQRPALGNWEDDELLSLLRRSLTTDLRDVQ